MTCVILPGSKSVAFSCQVNWNTAYMRVWTSFLDKIVETNWKKGKHAMKQKLCEEH